MGNQFGRSWPSPPALRSFFQQRESKYYQKWDYSVRLVCMVDVVHPSPSLGTNTYCYSCFRILPYSTSALEGTHGTVASYLIWIHSTIRSSEHSPHVRGKYSLPCITSITRSVVLQLVTFCFLMYCIFVKIKTFMPNETPKRCLRLDGSFRKVQFVAVTYGSLALPSIHHDLLNPIWPSFSRLFTYVTATYFT